MWYVMQVQTGNEEAIVKQCTKLIDKSVLESGFIPYYEEMKRYHGSWNKKQRILFPGYVFLISDDVETLYREMRQVVGLTKILGVKGQVIPLSEGEVSFLQSFRADKQVVAMSVGIIENDMVLVLEGPLKGYEGYIRRVDRHKRKVWIEIEMFGKRVDVQMGMEIVCKE